MRYLAWLAVALMACSADTFTSPDSSTGDGGGGDGGGGGPDAVGPDAVSVDACASPQTCPANGKCATFDSNGYGDFKDTSSALGSVEITSDHSVSCPNSLRATLQPVGAGTGAAQVSAALTLLSPNTMAHAKMEADVWLPPVIGSEMAFVALAANGDPANAIFLESQTDGTWHFIVRASGRDHAIAPRTGTWNHISLDAVLSQSNSIGQATIGYDDSSGQPRSDTINDTTIGGTTSTISNVLGQAGISGFGNDSTLTAWFDDLQLSSL